MNWYEEYKSDIEKHGGTIKYIDYKIKNKNKFIKLIKKYSYNKKIIEAGSGTSVLSIYMASQGYDVTAIDIDDKMIKLSKTIADEYNSQNKPKMVKKSIFELDYNENEFDISFSNGVLEHFSDEEIIDTIKQQLKIAQYVIVGVPTKYFKPEEAMHGDERYLEISHWKKLIKEANGKIIEETSFHYEPLKKRLFNYKKYLKIKPFKLFVIEKI